MPITYLSVRATAKELRVSRETIYKWIARKTLNGEEIADRLCVKRDKKFEKARRAIGGRNG